MTMLITLQASYSQQCNPGRYVDACSQMRDEVAEQWANDHVLLIIEYQEFEVLFLSVELINKIILTCIDN